ncbi:MAG: hypothetical protein WDO71_10740 [Bacteroidota bacterium]
MILYTHSITPRLQYIVEFIGKQIQGVAIQVTSSTEEFSNYDGPKINYSDKRITESEIRIKPHALLFEKNIKEQTIECFAINGHKAFFKTEDDLAFDIFSASFYLLSRYEEYLPHTKDIYGRYAFENSLAFKEEFLNLPLINIWVQDLIVLLKKKFPLFSIRTEQQSKDSPFTFLPTYDIDIAWSYKHKGWWRNTGGLVRSFITAKWPLMKERIQVLRGKQKDPFDSFGWLNKLHEKYKLKPLLLFLSTGKKRTL